VFGIAGEGRQLFTESLDGETFTVPTFFHRDDPLRDVFDESEGLENFLFDGEGTLCSE
jgi:hypothetical protein